MPFLIVTIKKTQGSQLKSRASHGDYKSFIVLFLFGHDSLKAMLIQRGVVSAHVLRQKAGESKILLLCLQSLLSLTFFLGGRGAGKGLCLFPYKTQVSIGCVPFIP